MDTITQALLGSAVAYSIAGRTAPRSSVIYGALFATLPDLDVLIQYSNDLDAMTLHRSWTHSWIVQILLAPLIAWLMTQADPRINFKQWWLMIWLVWITHSGLDAMTIYGTQLFWPFMPPPASIASIFIIDPLYTLPLAAGFLAIIAASRWPFSRHLMLGGLLLSSSYLSWSYLAQQVMEQQTRQALAEQAIDYQHIKVSPTALNTLLWRIVVIDEEHYYEAFRSFFDGDAVMEFVQFDRGTALTEQLSDTGAVEQLDWFSQGTFKLEQQPEGLLLTDLRMGMEPSYFFRFVIASHHDGHYQNLPPQQLAADRDIRRSLQWVWQRIFTADLPPMHQQIAAREY